MDNTVTFWEKTKIFLRSVPARVAAIATIVALAAPEVANVIPADAAQTPVQVAIQAVTFVLAVAAIIKRHTQVPPAAKGWAPPTHAVRWESRANDDRLLGRYTFTPYQRPDEDRR